MVSIGLVKSSGWAELAPMLTSDDIKKWREHNAPRLRGKDILILVLGSLPASTARRRLVRFICEMNIILLSLVGSTFPSISGSPRLLS